MSEKPISPLRQRMIEDISVQFRREESQRLYPPRQDFRSLPRPLARYDIGSHAVGLPCAPPLGGQCLRACEQYHFLSVGSRTPMEFCKVTAAGPSAASRD
jgi:hypothetical protein